MRSSSLYPGDIVKQIITDDFWIEDYSCPRKYSRYVMMKKKRKIEVNCPSRRNRNNNNISRRRRRVLGDGKRTVFLNTRPLLFYLFRSRVYVVAYPYSNNLSVTALQP